MGHTGTVVNLEFQGILGLDSSTFNFDLKDLNISNPQGSGYVYSTSTPGCVTVDSICGINVSKINYTEAASISQNTPNPFSEATDIHFSLPAAGHARMTILNDLGVVVATPLDQDLSSGEFDVRVNATNLPSGLYYYRLQTAAGSYQRTMSIVK